jgi:hypothetical protein
MTRRLLALPAVPMAIALVALTAPPVATQTTKVPALVITAYNGGPPTTYVTPKTPWGEPDLQGVWSSDDTSGIPRERPAELEMRLYQTDEEFAAR